MNTMEKDELDKLIEEHEEQAPEEESQEVEKMNEIKEKTRIKGCRHGFDEMMGRDFRQIPNEILICLMGSKLVSSDICIFLYIYHKTFGYRKYGKDAGEKFSYADISAFTGLHKKTVEKALRRLEDAHIISRKRMERKVFIKINADIWGAWRIDKTGKDNAAAHIMKKSGYYEDEDVKEDGELDGDLEKELDDL